MIRSRCVRNDSEHFVMPELIILECSTITHPRSVLITYSIANENEGNVVRMNEYKCNSINKFKQVYLHRKMLKRFHIVLPLSHVLSSFLIFPSSYLIKHLEKSKQDHENNKEKRYVYVQNVVDTDL